MRRGRRGRQNARILVRVNAILLTPDSPWKGRAAAVGIRDFTSVLGAQLVILGAQPVVLCVSGSGFRPQLADVRLRRVVAR